MAWSHAVFADEDIIFISGTMTTLLRDPSIAFQSAIA